MQASLPMQILLEFVQSCKNPEQKDLAKSHLENGYRKIPSPNAFDRFYYFDFLCWYELEENRLNQALSYSDSMETAAKEMEDAVQYRAYAGKIQAEILYRMQRYPEAILELDALAAMRAEDLDSCTLAELLSLKAALLYEQADYLQALDFAKRAVAETRRCASEQNASALTLLHDNKRMAGKCYERMNIPDSARHSFNEALGFLNTRERIFPHDSLSHFKARAELLMNLGNLELTAGNTDHALDRINAAVVFHQRTGQLNNANIEVQLKRAKILLMQKSLKETAEQFAGIREALGNKSVPELEMELYLLESQYFEAVSLPQSAHLAYKQHIRLRDSLALMQDQTRNNPVISTPVASSDEGENGYSPNQNEEQIYLKGSLVLLFVLLVVIYLIRRNLIESREHVRDLNQLNQEIKEQNEQLHAAMQALENSFEENERVMRIVSHDLRNPVGSIVSLALLLKANESLDNSAKEYSNMIHTLSKDVLGFMEEVLNLKTGMDMGEMNREDLFELLSYCISFMEFKAQEKGQTITLSGESVFVMVSREKIWRVFINILSNAIKFSPKNKSIEVYLEGDAKRALVSVTDHGIGIPDELKDKVFDMLTEAKRNGTDGEKAHGLGMAISKQIMEAHGGKIWLESEEGKGTTFFLEFSKEGVVDEPKQKQKQKPKENKGPRYSARVV